MWARLWHNLFRYLVQNPSNSITYYKIPMSKNGNFLFHFSIIFSLLEIACKFIQLQKILTVCLANPNEKFFISSSISFMIRAKQEITKITRIEWKGKNTASVLTFWVNPNSSQLLVVQYGLSMVSRAPHCWLKKEQYLKETHYMAKKEIKKLIRFEFMKRRWLTL